MQSIWARTTNFCFYLLSLGASSANQPAFGTERKGLRTKGNRLMMTDTKMQGNLGKPFQKTGLANVYFAGK